jgi:hypothetical protein
MSDARMLGSVAIYPLMLLPKEGVAWLMLGRDRLYF